MANIYNLLPTFNYIEVNNLKGIHPGFVVAQMEVAESAKATLLKDGRFFENGKICAISADGIVAGTAESKAAVDTTEECPRLVQLIPGDEWMSTDPNCAIEGRIVKVSNTENGWYSVTTMANGDAGYHYMFLG